METIKKSYEELLTLIQLLNLSVTDGKTIGEKKLGVFAKKVQPYLDAYNEKLEDIKLDNASVDKDKNLIMNEKGGYLYTAEATKKVSKEIRELLKEEFDFTIVPVRQNIDLEKYTFLNGWVSGLSFEEKEEEEEIEL